MASNDDWSIQTPPRMFSPKRQKIEAELVVKIAFKEVADRAHHMTHVFFLQTVLNTMGEEVKALNQRGQVLKASVFPALSEEAVYKNHFILNEKSKKYEDNRKTVFTVIHQFRGVNHIKAFKKNPKVMAYLRENKIHISNHEWKEEDWDVTVVGFLTHIYPESMPSEHATKIVSGLFKTSHHRQKPPLFRVKPVLVRGKTSGGMATTRAFGIEVKRSDIKAMQEAIKSNLDPGIFVPFQMKQVNETAYNKAVEYVASKNANIWTIVIQYMSEGSFFKLEEKFKALPSVEHVIYDPAGQKARVLVPKSTFYCQRDALKAKLKQWVSDLDPDDIREWGIPPEVSHISKDDFSGEDGSFFTNSIALIMTFDVEEVVVHKVKPNTKSGSGTITTSTPSELSVPPVIITKTADETEVHLMKVQITTYQKIWLS
jgi:hypothetical protein